MIWLLDTNTIIYAQYLGGRVRDRLVSDDGALLAGDIEGLVAENWI